MSHKSEMAGPFNRGDTIINKHFTFINESCYKGIILQRNYRKMTIFHVKKNGATYNDHIISKYFISPCVIKGLHYAKFYRL